MFIKFVLVKQLKQTNMKTFLSKQKYQVYAIGIIAVYFLTRFFY